MQKENKVKTQESLGYRIKEGLGELEAGNR